MSLFLLFPLIFVTSLVLTMVGLGGALIFAPLFILMEYPISTAVSASLFLNGIAAVSAAITYFQKKMVDTSIGLPLIISSSLLAPVGAFFTARVSVRDFSAILAGVIFLAALRMLFSGRVESETTIVTRTRKIVGGGAIGIVIGFMAGLLGIGGGIFIVPLLIYVLKVPTKTAAATSIFIVTFSSFAGFAGHVSMAKLDWRFILPAAVFSFAGGQFGSRIMADKLKGKTIRKIFGGVLLVFAFKLIQKFVY